MGSKSSGWLTVSFSSSRLGSKMLHQERKKEAVPQYLISELRSRVVRMRPASGAGGRSAEARAPVPLDAPRTGPPRRPDARTLARTQLPGVRNTAFRFTVLPEFLTIWFLKPEG